MTRTATPGSGDAGSLTTMGILGGPLEYLRQTIARLPQGFSVCELGDQWITHGEHRLARSFYEELGCGRYESVDGNGRGTITADLNRPLVPWPGEFDLVTDFGTGEHIFDQRQVFKTLHDLTKVGGFIVFDRPTQGYPEHCYWNANECVWRDVARANDYEVVSISRSSASRGELLRGVFLRKSDGKFRVPQQGRYRKLLRPITGETAKEINKS